MRVQVSIELELCFRWLSAISCSAAPLIGDIRPARAGQHQDQECSQRQGERNDGGSVGHRSGSPGEVLIKN
jgi:hypothetical protein